jgi:hypothetical protein
VPQPPDLGLKTIEKTGLCQLPKKDLHLLVLQVLYILKQDNLSNVSQELNAEEAKQPKDLNKILKLKLQLDVLRRGILDLEDRIRQAGGTIPAP